MSASGASATQAEEEKNEYENEEAFIRKKVEKKVRKKLKIKKGGIPKISNEDRAIVLANRKKTLELVEDVKSDLATYRKLRKKVNRLFAIARAEAKERRLFIDRASNKLNELKKLNPGCCGSCGLMGGHPKGRYCEEYYCEDNAYRSSDSCFPPLYWGKEFSEEEYKQLYCNRVDISEQTPPSASDSDPSDYFSEEDSN